MIKTALVLFLGIIMIGSTYSMSSSYAQPQNLPDVSQAPFKVRVIDSDGLRAEIRPLITTAGNPGDYLTGSGGNFDGVGDVILQRSDFSGLIRCSGSLLNTGMHVLTAAHCVTDSRGNYVLLSGLVFFDGDTNVFEVAVDASSTVVHPDWKGDILKGRDLAILKLVSTVSGDIQRYGIDSNPSDDLQTEITKVGYGRTGNGDEGDEFKSGHKRDGKNQYDAVADQTLRDLKVPKKFVDGSIVQFDFDNGLEANDAYDFFYEIEDTGLGLDEVNTAPGDSGGPAFNALGEITGITSYGLRLSYIFGGTSDVDGTLNSSFGEFSGDTRVSSFAGWIDSVLNSTPPPPDDDEPNPCPRGKAKNNKC